MEELLELLQDARENWRDPHWRMDHQELLAVAVAVVTGIIGLGFAVLQVLITRRLAPNG